MKYLKPFYLTAALVAASSSFVANAALTSDKQLMVFEATDNDVPTATQTITVAFELGDTISLPTAPDIATTGFELTANTCDDTHANISSGVASAAGECSITANFTPSVAISGKRSFLYEINEGAAGTHSIPIFMSNYYDESDADEAKRRISPIVEKLVLSSSEGASLSTLEEGKEYTLDVYIASYDEQSKITVRLDDCDDNNVTCTNGNGNLTILENQTLNSSAVDKSEWSVLGLSDYRLASYHATHQKVSLTFTIPSNTFELDAVNKLQLRVYHRSFDDNDRRVTTNATVIFGGNLNEGIYEYVDVYGRKLGINGPDNSAP